MTTKLHSLPTQLAALQGMCIRKAAVRGMILAQVDESHMYHDECKEVLRYILDTIDRKGEPPVFELLKENPKLSKETREMLRANLKTKVDVPVNRGAAQDLVDQLNHFRQLRIFYGMCMDGMELLRKKSLEVNDMTSLAETALAQLRVNKALKDQIIHFDEASMQEVVKDILWGEDTDNYIPTGWECFDAVNGGFPLEALVVLGGASGAGKCVHPSTLVTLDIVELRTESGFYRIPGIYDVRLTDGSSVNVRRIVADSSQDWDIDERSIAQFVVAS